MLVNSKPDVMALAKKKPATPHVSAYVVASPGEVARILGSSPRVYGDFSLSMSPAPEEARKNI